MVGFPETAESEWKIIAHASLAEEALRARLAEDTQVEAELIKMRRRHRAKVLLEAELQAEDTPELDMMTLADYRNSPHINAPTDLIDGVLNDDSVMTILGPSRAGKSTLALQMMHCMGTGTKFLSQDVKQVGGSFGIMSYDMPGRLMFDWIDGLPNVDPYRFSIVNAHKRGNPLAVPEQRALIAKTWKAKGTDVVMIDSFSASFFGGDENDAAAIMAHYRDMKTFALTEVGAKVLIVIVHSTSSSPHKPRGSSVHMDAVDTMLAVWPEGGPSGARHTEMLKYRNMRGQTAMEPRVLTAPDPVTNLVDIDAQGMVMADMSPPVDLGAAAFPDVYEEPDTDSSSDLESEDDL